MSCNAEPFPTSVILGYCLIGVSVRLLATSTKICTIDSSTVPHGNRFKAYCKHECYKWYKPCKHKLVSISIRNWASPSTYSHSVCVCATIGIVKCRALQPNMSVSRLSAIRFRGGVILQVSCYTLLMRIPTSMATVLLSAPHGTPFRVYRKVEAGIVKPGLSWERQVESLIASSAYQKWPTTDYSYN